MPHTPSTPENGENGRKLAQNGARQDINAVVQSEELSPALRAFLVEQRRAAITLARSTERLLGLQTEEARLRAENAELRATVARLQGR
jgi:hypothetical protein